MKLLQGLLALAMIAAAVGPSKAQESYSWRYYRVGNTGIQGDYHEAVWIGADGNPYLGGYDPIFEEGGFAKFIQEENRWVNYSNIDYPVIGHPNNTGCTRVTDIVPDATGKLWMGTWLGALQFDPAVGATSLIHYGPANSALNEDRVWDLDRAPDGTMWFVNNGIVRFNPATTIWTRWETGLPFIAAQPKATGGYLVWSSERPPSQSFTLLFDSDTQNWTTLNPTGVPGEVVGMPGKDCVDETGNFWALRSRQPGDFTSLDYRRPDGTWVPIPEPYYGVTFNIAAFKAYGDRRAVLVDDSGNVYQFAGSSWTSLGQWGGSAYSADVDATGNVWVCGVGGAAKWSVQTGHWQRYRITNTGNYDNFNRDLTIDPTNGNVYTGANASPGVGGMVRFDGTRWTGWNQLTYGLGHDWPFPNDYCEALAYRTSNGRVAVSPLEWLYGIHEWNGSGFTPLPPLSGAVRMSEDSQGRLWAIGEYFNLNYHNGTAWIPIPIVGWGAQLRKDPTRPGTVWAATDYEIQRTDGSYSFSRSIDDFPGSATWFTGLAADANGIAWIGTWTQFTSTGSTLIRLDANTGLYQMFQHDQGWPFPGEHVRPMAITPDGRLWMQYDSEYPSTDAGLCWYDGVNVGTFPAPPGGEPQWGGLPHSGIHDLEVREIAGGYELWMSCVSRGLAVLTVHGSTTAVAPPTVASAARLVLAQNHPNPFNGATRIRFELPAAESVRLDIFDVSGRLVRRLLEATLSPGSHDVDWDGRTNGMESSPSGVYLCRLQAGGEVVEQRMLLLR